MNFFHECQWSAECFRRRFGNIRKLENLMFSALFSNRCLKHCLTLMGEEPKYEHIAFMVGFEVSSMARNILLQVFTMCSDEKN